jgi:hypothetical protein
MSEENQIVVREKSPLIDTKTVVIGGGLVALIAFLFFRGGGKGGRGVDSKPLLFKLRPYLGGSGLFLGDSQQPISIPDAIARVLAGGRKDALLQTRGDTRSGDVDAVDVAFQQAGITLRSQTQTASLYSRGMGRIA